MSRRECGRCYRYSCLCNRLYDFGTWGYHTNDSMGQLMPGFYEEPPGVEICGRYDLVFAAAVRYNNVKEAAELLFRRQVKGSMSIQVDSKAVNVAIGRRNNQVIFQERSIFSGSIFMDEDSQYFGPGYHFHGFAADSVASQSYDFKAYNAAMVVTKRNNNIGRLMVVSETKAFRRVDTEMEVMADPDQVYESQLHETQEAERICRCRHYAWLCRDLGLPCATAALITQFVTAPFLFAQPGDVWIDIRLTTPVRTYVLARPCPVVEEHVSD